MTFCLFFTIALLTLAFSARGWSAGAGSVNLAPVHRPPRPRPRGATAVNRPRRGKLSRTASQRRYRGKLNRLVRVKRIEPAQSRAGTTDLGDGIQLVPMDPFVGKPQPVMNASTDPSTGPFVGAQVRLTLGQ